MGIRSIVRALVRAPAPTGSIRVDYDPGAWQKLDPSWDNDFTSAGWMNYRVNIVEWVMRIQDECEDMLDTGCHIGHFIEELRRRGFRPRYQGVDITPQFVERARERLPEERFDLGDVRALDFPDESFDLVLCVGVLMHLPELASPLAHVFRTARKYVLLSTYGSKGETYSRHDGRQGFMNHFYSKADVVAQVPPDWELVEYEEFQRPNRPTDNWIFQFLLRRRGDGCHDGHRGSHHEGWGPLRRESG